MVLLLTGTAFGLVSLVAAIILQFKFPLWRFFAGISGMSAARRGNVDIPRLTRRLSVVFYILAAGLLSGALLLSVKLIPESILIPVYFLVALVSFDLVWFFWKKCDRNQYSRASIRAGRFFFILIHFSFFVLCLAFIR
jgi:hypothetical protein